MLRTDWLLRTYYHNGLRGLRLTAYAKKLLSAEYPDRFVFLFTGDTATSTPKYALVHRLRLHRMAEVRLKSLLEIELCLHRLPDQFSGVGQSAIVFGADMSHLLSLMGVGSANRQSYFLSGESFRQFHYLTSDHYGEVVLQLVCDPEKKQSFDSILSEDLSPSQPGLIVENDAMDGDDPVLFGYTCDMPRIKRFDNALHIHDKKGTLYCFDFQEDVLRELCGPNVSIQVIDFEAYEANVFHAVTGPCGNTQET